MRHSTLKLGKLPASLSKPVKLKFRDFLDRTQLPPLPKGDFGHDSLVTNWGMLGNDKYGCCFAEGTLVSPGDVNAAMRIPYDGPVVSLHFASGKRLTVTPNHAVLTPAGFTIAALLQEGDDCISASGAETMQRLFGRNNRDHSPAPVEQVFASLLRSGNRATRRVSVMPSVDLDGDARFFDGDVEVVTANRLLERETHSPLSKPHGEEKVSATGKLKASLHRRGTTLKPSFASRPSPHGSVGGTGHGLALLDRELGVVQGQAGALLPDLIPGLNEHAPKVVSIDARTLGDQCVGLASPISLEKLSKVSEFAVAADSKLLADSPHLYASITKPTADGVRTDPDLAGNLLKRCPGLVSTDRVINIERKWLSGHVYDLSTETRWLISNGIVTHNCVWAGAGHEEMLWLREAGQSEAHVEALFTEKAALRNYSQVTGFNPNDPSTDQGTDMAEAAAYRRKTGYVDAKGNRHKIGAYVDLDPGNITELWYAAWLFDGVGIGVNFPSQWMDAFNKGPGGLWDHVARPKLEGGHYITGVGRHGNLNIVTWDDDHPRLTPRGYAQFNDQTIAYASAEKLISGKDDNGFDWPGLLAALKEIDGQP